MDDPCAWRDATDAHYFGTCRDVAGGLICVRNQPIIASPTGSKGNHGAGWVRAVTYLGAILMLLAAGLAIWVSRMRGRVGNKDEDVES